MNTVRQQLISAVVARLGQIRTGDENDFQTDIGLRVQDWETNFQEDELPALSVCDLVENIEMDFESVNQINRLPLLIRIFDNDKNPVFLRKVIGDIYRAIGLDRRFIVNGVGLARGTIIKSAGIILKQDEFEIGGAAVEIEIAYYTKAFNAFDY